MSPFSNIFVKINEKFPILFHSPKTKFVFKSDGLNKLVNYCELHHHKSHDYLITYSLK